MFQSTRTLNLTRAFTTSALPRPSPRPRDPKIINLDKPIGGLAAPIYIEKSQVPKFYQTQVSELPNGVWVASQPRFGKYSTVGVAIGAGSRFEKGFPNGVSHFVEKLGFSGSRNYKDKNSVISALEEFGGLCDAQTARDTTVYACSANCRGLEKVMDLLSNTVLQPTLPESDIDEARQSVLYEKEDMDLRPEQEVSILEMIHHVAWGNNTLGYSKYCLPENVNSIKRDHILKYLKTYYTPERMVVAGVGVEHEELVDLAEKYFDFTKATWNIEKFEGSDTYLEPDRSGAVYQGGQIQIEKDFGQFNAGPLPVPNLAHIAIGLESISHNDPDFITACVLNILMGGGGSFSAGGPGKGMYSRLYRNVLNQLHWVYNTTAYNNSYYDSGVFCVYAACPPDYLKDLVTILTREISGMLTRPSDQEVERSKTQLQSMLLMNLESRTIVFEDIVRQILANGVYRSPEEYISQIENVSEEDISRLVKRLLSSKLSVAALGNLHQLPTYEEINSELQAKIRGIEKGTTTSRFNLFRS